MSAPTPCLLDDPVVIAEAMHKRAEAYRNATSEDEQLAAAESTWHEYAPLCMCPHCAGEDNEQEGDDE